MRSGHQTDSWRPFRAPSHLGPVFQGLRSFHSLTPGYSPSTPPACKTAGYSAFTPSAREKFSQFKLRHYSNTSLTWFRRSIMPALTPLVRPCASAAAKFQNRKDTCTPAAFFPTIGAICICVVFEREKTVSCFRVRVSISAPTAAPPAAKVGTNSAVAIAEHSGSLGQVELTASTPAPAPAARPISEPFHKLSRRP